MKNYTWKIKSLQAIDEVNEKDFVTSIFYEVDCTEEVDGKEYKASAVSSIVIKPKEEEGFVAYSELTEEQVIGWVKESLGKEGVDSIEKSLASQVDKKINPPVVPTVKPLPWI
jgi:hypothetical protein